ncbi:MAG: GcrA family cell cycle regulator [Ferrovibrio sp.]|uniref:GcrA family cell cycle regulator n=1 Tax=Ferrovibrio sp. TaxID=1917215 RepID=UPI00391BD98E
MVGAYGDGDQNAIRGEYGPTEAGGLVYALVDPRDHCIFYIGLTRDLEARKRMHFAGGHSVSGEKIKVIRRNGLVPLVVVLEADIAETRLRSAEAFWIEIFRQRGAPLLNVPSDSAERRRLWTSARSEGFGAPKLTTTILRVEPADEFENTADSEERRRHRVQQLGQPPNTGKPWTDHEEKALRSLLQRGLRAAEIARRIGRSRDAVASRMGRLGLVELRDRRLPSASP